MTKNKQVLAPMPDAANHPVPAAAQSSEEPTRAPRRMAREPMVGPESAADKAAPESPTPGSKIAQVLALLRRRQGATLAEMVAATG